MKCGSLHRPRLWFMWEPFYLATRYLLPVTRFLHFVGLASDSQIVLLIIFDQTRLLLLMSDYTPTSEVGSDHQPTSGDSAAVIM